MPGCQNGLESWHIELVDMVKIVIADAMEKEVVEGLSKLGQVVVGPGNLKSDLVDADVLVVRSATKVTAELIADAKKLKIVARAGVGLDNVDRAACEAKGIKVINTPSASTEAVAELAIGMMICIGRKIGFAHYKMKCGAWEKKACVGHEIGGKTLGILGMGRIGQSVGRKASALGMKVLYYDKNEIAGAPGRKADMDDLLANSDYVAIHASGTDRLIGEAEISKMRNGAYLINLARGHMVDEKALVAALKSGKLAGAALDVYEKEPYTQGELLSCDNVILTPHIGAASDEAQGRIGKDLVEQLKKML